MSLRSRCIKLVLYVFMVATSGILATSPAGISWAQQTTTLYVSNDVADNYGVFTLDVAVSGNTYTNANTGLPFSGALTPLIAPGTLINGTALLQPQGVAVDTVGNVFVADLGNNRIVQRTTSGILSVVGGNIPTVQGLAFDGLGNLFASSYGNGELYKISYDAATKTFGSAQLFAQDLSQNGTYYLTTYNGNQILAANAGPSATGTARNNPPNVVSYSSAAAPLPTTGTPVYSNAANLSGPLGLAARGTEAYAANFDGNTVVGFAPGNNTALDIFSLPGSMNDYAPTGLAYGSVPDRLFASQQNFTDQARGRISAINPTTGDVAVVFDATAGFLFKPTGIAAFSAVPEPSTGISMVFGTLLGLTVLHRRRRYRKNHMDRINS